MNQEREAIEAKDIISLALLGVGDALLWICVFTPYWKIIDPEDTLRDNQYIHEGLWITCTTMATGNWDCDDFNRWFLGLPAELQVARGFALLGFAVGIGAVIAFAIGCICNTCNPRINKIAKIISGCLSIAAALCILLATGFYANRVIQNYWEATYLLQQQRRTGVIRFIFGWSLYFGWAAGAVLLIIGIVIAILGCSSKTEEQGQYGGNNFYDPNHPQAHRNYAYKQEQPAPIYDKDYV